MRPATLPKRDAALSHDQAGGLGLPQPLYAGALKAPPGLSGTAPHAPASRGFSQKLQAL